LLLEKQGNPVVPAIANKSKDCRYKKFVTFWPEYVNIWKNIVGDKLEYVPACVDTNEFKPVEKDWSVPQILISDMWREDVTPFNVIMIAGEFALKYPGSKIHICGIDKSILNSLTPFLEEFQRLGILGDISMQTKKIKDWYAKCNMLITPHVIATRSVREAMACGLKVSRNTCSVANIESCWLHPPEARGFAETVFGMRWSGVVMEAVLKSVLPKEPKTRKVFVDVGAHLGESVKRFYREVPDADEYEIYCFEPDLETFIQLDKNIGHIKNVNLINAALGEQDGMIEFYPGEVNDNEGGTSLPSKATGGVRYDKPEMVESICFARWCENNLGDYNIAKINIEGGEYDLMEIMLDHGIVFDKLFIQLHAHKFEFGKQRRWMQQIEGQFSQEYKGKLFMKNKGFYPFDAQ